VCTVSSALLVTLGCRSLCLTLSPPFFCGFALLWALPPLAQVVEFFFISLQVRTDAASITATRLASRPCSRLVQWQGSCPPPPLPTDTAVPPVPCFPSSPRSFCALVYKMIISPTPSDRSRRCFHVLRTSHAPRSVASGLVE